MKDLLEIETELECCNEAFEKANEILNNSSLENTRSNFQDSLNELRNDLDDQLRRIRKKDFEIAAVGREKAGKSSLLNAWIGFELLPTESVRCTYTTTEIRSCTDANEQRYLIEYFSRAEFESKFVDTDSISGIRGCDLLKQQEKEEIKKYQNEISSYLGKSSLTKYFASFDEVKKELRSAIADPGHARAVKKICIWTPELSVKENVVLHDVPGYDSPLTLHKEQTNAKIAAVDAILFAKLFRSPDLVDCEIEILEINDLNNSYIKAKDKLIVALTNCDLAGSAREYNELASKSRKAWKIKDIPESRIIPVCSLAESRNSKTPEQLHALKNLTELNGGKSGFAELKQAVNQCIQDIKYKIALERCNEIKNKIVDLCKSLQEEIKDKYKLDANSDIKDSLNEDEMQKIYLEWWTQKWKSIHENFQTFFYTEIRPNLSPDDPSFLNQDDLQFKKLYDTTIEETFRRIPASQKKRQLLIYNSVIHAGIVSPKEGNTKIRTELSYETLNSLEKLTENLNKFLWKNIDRMIAWIRKEMWNLPEIREEVICKDESVASGLIKCSFDALIKRLGRPCTDIFLRFPRSKIERIKVMQEFQMELLVIDKFMINGKLMDRGLHQFLANGKHGKIDIEIRQNEVVYNSNMEVQEEINAEPIEALNKSSNFKGSNESLNSVMSTKVKDGKKKGLFSKIKHQNEKKDIEDLSQSQIVEKTKPVETKYKMDHNQYAGVYFSPDAENVAQIQNEIEEDINEFLECMKNSVFYGSGIQRYYNQELDNLRRRFISLENEKGRWSFYVFKYLKQKDSKVTIPAPTMDDEIKSRTNIIKNMKEINQIIDKFYF